MNRRGEILVLCVSLLLAASTTQAQELGSITLLVQDETGASVVNAEVHAVNWDQSRPRTRPLADEEKGITDSEGKIAFNNKTVGQVFARVIAGDKGGWFRVHDHGPLVPLTIGVGNTYTGVVRDRLGHAVPGARVVADYTLPMGETDAEGRFSVPHCGVSYTPEFAFYKPGLAWTGTRPHFQPESITVVMPPGMEIDGIATLPNGDPAANIEIYSYPFFCDTDEMGRFLIPSLELGFELTVTASALVDQKRYTGKSEIVVSQSLAQPVKLTLESYVEAPRYTLRGRVVHADTGEPVAADILLDNSQEFAFPDEEALTKEDGSFVVENMRSGHYWVFAAPVNPALYTIGAPRPIQVKEGEPPKDLEFKVADGCAIRGRVVDARGNPLDRQQVLWDPMGPYYRAIWTNGDGYFVIPNLNGNGVTFTLSIRDEFNRDVPVQVGPMAKSEIRSGVEIRMPDLSHAGVLRGSAVDPAGNPIANLHIRFENKENRPISGMEGLTDANGAFKTKILADGELTAKAHFIAQVPAGDDHVNHWRPCEVLKGGKLNIESGRDYSIELVVKPEPLRIAAGVVQDQDGQALDATVRVIESDGYSDSVATSRKGEFLIQHLPDEPCVIEVTMEGYHAKVLIPDEGINTSGDPETITLTKGPIPYGVPVWTVVTGRPATEEALATFPCGKAIMDRLREYYRLVNLAPQKVEAPTTPRPRMSVDYAVRVVGPDGAPLKSVLMAPLQSTAEQSACLLGRQPQSAFSSIDGDGNYEFPVERAIVTAPGMGRVAFEPTYGIGRVEPQTLWLKPAAELTLRVTDGDGHPAQGVRISAPERAWLRGKPDSSTDRLEVAVTDEKGIARLSGLAPGCVALTLSERGTPTQLVVTALSSGARATETVELATGTTAPGSALMQEWRRSVSIRPVRELAEKTADGIARSSQSTVRDLRKVTRAEIEALTQAESIPSWAGSEIILLSTIVTALNDEGAAARLQRLPFEYLDFSLFALPWPQSDDLVVLEAIADVLGDKALPRVRALATDSRYAQTVRIAALAMLGRIGSAKSVAMFAELRDAARADSRAPEPLDAYTHAQRMAESAYLSIYFITRDPAAPLTGGMENLHSAQVSEDYERGTISFSRESAGMELHMRRFGEEWLISGVGLAANP